MIVRNEQKTERDMIAESLQALMTSAPVGFALLDMDFRFLRVNESLAATHGLEADRHPGKAVYEVVPHLWRALEPLLEHVVTRGEAASHREISGTTVAKPDEVRHWLASVYPIRHSDARVWALGLILVETTQQKRNEEALQRSQRNLSDFFNNAVVGLHWVGPDGRLLRVNQAELDLLGYTEAEYVGRHLSDFHADPRAIADILERLARNETLHNYEAKLRAKDGSIKDVLISSNVLWEDGRFIHTRSFTRDITLRKRAEAALRLQEQQVELITNAVPALISYIDADQRYRFANKQYELWLGQTRQQMYGKTMQQVLGDATYEALRPHISAALAGREVSFETWLTQKDDGEKWIKATYVPHLDDQGRVLGFIVLVIDLTDRKLAEEERERLLAELEEERRRLEESKQLLQEKIEDLELFHDLVVGRELKMIAVEKENEELKQLLSSLQTESSSEAFDGNR